MAVMTSLHPAGDAFEHKTQPVPSSDKMALDLDINGAQRRDDSDRDTSHADPATTPVPDIPPHSVAPLKTSAVENWDATAKNAEVGCESDLCGAHKGLEGTTRLDSVLNSVGARAAPNSLDAREMSTSSSDPHPSINQPHSAELSTSPGEVSSVDQARVSGAREEILLTSQETRGSPTDAINLTAVGLNSNNSPILAEIPSSSVDEHPIHPASVSNLDLNSASQSDLPSSPGPIADVDMLDAPESPTKVARVRDEDVGYAPSAKRTKTEDGSPTDDGPAAALEPAGSTTRPAMPNGNSVAGDELPPTDYQQKELLKIIKHIKGTIHGRNFKASVEQLWPFYEAYRQKINNPIDLSIIEQRLRLARQPDGYQTLAEFKNDVELLYNNTLIFNGPDHEVTIAGSTTRDNILSKIPPPEPIKQERKRKGTPLADAAPRAAPARRQSRGVPTAAGSPTAAASPTQTFALDPSGTPVIRRDSAKVDSGRPKREIHPPKSKDLPYNARPKKKKFATELKFCDEVLNELKKPKYHHWAAPFLVPVDPVALSIPDYYKIIKNPMDLQTVEERLNSGQYENAKDFESDMKLIFKNCYKFNPAGSPVHDMGKAIEGVFNDEWAKKGQWISDHTTVSNAASPNSAGESDDDESEEEETEEPMNSSNALADRLIEEQNKLIAIMGAKKPDPVLVRMQQDMVAIVRGQMLEQTAKRSKAAKTKPAKPSKRGAPAKKKADTKKSYRVKIIGLGEKEQISAGITQLEGKLLDQAVAYLKMDYPNLNLDDETELDIDQFSNETLSRLHDLIVKNVPGIASTKPEPASRASKPARPKKSKPMGKVEQEIKIEKLRKLKDEFERQGSMSDEAPAGHVVPSVEQDQSSGDESPSDSEED